MMTETRYPAVGYNEFVDFLSSDGDIFILRRFDTAHARVLLHLQDQVSQLEKSLESIEESRNSEKVKTGKEGSARDDADAEQILEKMRAKLENYGKHSAPAPAPAPNLNIQNVKTRLGNRNQPIHFDEVDFVNQGDLISLASSKKPALRRAFEQNVLARTSGLWGLFPAGPKRQRGKDDISTTLQGDDGRVDLVARVAIFLVVLSMLITPLWALAYMHDMKGELAVITSFTLVLLVFLASGTTARPFEMLAATAGQIAPINTPLCTVTWVAIIY
ncbi:phytase [Colletotrichum sojae]|uniref:Phytase n=1 Tax=Colletotrichum sojae TaxID=2175907 RepID=A0A8H6MMZ3_9PEZI|nr:phytase [Colletotrichum sojae]